MQPSYTYKPFRFFLITFLGSWSAGFIAAYLSYQSEMERIQFLFIFLGIIIPFIAALIMIYGSKNKLLVQDFWDRLRFNRIKLSFIPVILFLMPFVVFLATALSLLFGRSISQFEFSSEYNILKGQGLVSLLILFIAPLFEELGWRGYGVDSLRSKFNLFKTTILFYFLWALWHLPAFFIKGYYHRELWNTNIIYVINLFASMLPAAILMNWVYYKNNRSMTAAVLLHFTINLFSVIFKTEQFTKCIITILLLIISVMVIIKNKSFFFSNNKVVFEKTSH